jgi:hypothetical protein
MIVESIVGGTGIVLAAIGFCSVCRLVRKKATCWLNPALPNLPQPETLKDPTPSFTVELVRTVLEHQARREDQHRQQLSLLLMQLANMQECGGCSSIPFVDPDEKPLAHRNGNGVANTRDGMVARTISRLLPGLRR